VLVLEQGEGSPGATFKLEGEQVGAGRSQGEVLFPSDPYLAPHHASFIHRNGGLWLRDEGGASGVFVRVRAVAQVRAGDFFVIGERLFRIAGVLPSPPLPAPDGTMRLGSPRPHVPSVLIEEWLEGGSPGRAFLRPIASLTLGRAGCSINLGQDASLSQAHAELVGEADGSFRLRDLGSSNGTFVRIPPRGESQLQEGDQVRMGRELLRVTAG
jgi:pSer/pThr/pTyr-binding forkhead associated (FHA) protein